jgi:hypothetical protein
MFNIEKNKIENENNLMEMADKLILDTNSPYKYSSYDFNNNSLKLLSFAGKPGVSGDLGRCEYYNNQPIFTIINNFLNNQYLNHTNLDKESQGELFSNYIDGKIIEGIEETTNIIIVKDKKSKSKNNEVNEFLTISKKKISKSKIETKITNEDKEIDEIEKNINDELNDFKVSKKKTLKPKIIINDDNNKIKEKKIIKKIKIKKSNNNEI